jgi:putative (di)nucleoside polyphosphate hydrolase
MEKPYRPCVVAVLTKDYKEFLVGERQNIPGAWQFPQGGIEDGESPEVAVIRELGEETGTSDAVIERVSAEWISYDFPDSFTHSITQKFKGQRQKWFLLKLANGAKPDLDLSDGEFRGIDWRPLKVIIADVVDWKQECYREGLRALELEV